MEKFTKTKCWFLKQGSVQKYSSVWDFVLISFVMIWNNNTMEAFFLP